MQIKSKEDRAFSVAELLISLGIVGLVASIGIPVYQTYHRKSLIAEASLLLKDLTEAEVRYFIAPRIDPKTSFQLHACYLEALPSPEGPPAAFKREWEGNAYFDTLGFRPIGKVLFSYAVAWAPPFKNRLNRPADKQPKGGHCTTPIDITPAPPSAATVTSAYAFADMNEKAVSDLDKPVAIAPEPFLSFRRDLNTDKLSQPTMSSIYSSAE